MKIFAIRDESTQEQKDLAYLLYYKQEKQFYIELPENADAWETPLLLDSFVKRRETTVNSYWSKIWVQQRIVPIDRQNIGEILRDNHLRLPWAACRPRHQGLSLCHCCKPYPAGTLHSFEQR